MFRRTANWATAEDITEMVFLELWRQRHRLETKGGSLRPWLVSVASNHVKRGWRSAERQARAYAKIVRWVHDGEDMADVAVGFRWCPTVRLIRVVVPRDIGAAARPP